ncbi:hypothetical protein GCM10023188_47200 [Pontibacter saemangeumensis]|uniref:DUF5329 domain-containing protein n=1 Tax=Pontibacter saemangeumensis TaxID=1084525 RepID=A0ABP8M9B8_9BACT
MKIRVMLGMALVVGLLSAGVAAATPSAVNSGSSLRKALTEKQKVDRLLEFIRSLKDATFIRNGSEHNCEDAAKHLQAKWEKHQSKISTAEEFIESLASASGLTGEPYRIRFADGTTVTTKEVLMQELKRLEQE